jgi:hypothetical protein
MSKEQVTVKSKRAPNAFFIIFFRMSNFSTLPTAYCFKREANPFTFPKNEVFTVIVETTHPPLGWSQVGI